MSRFERFYVYSVPRVWGLFIGAAFYVFLTRIAPHLIVWIIDSGNLKTTQGLIEFLKFASVMTDSRNPFVIFFVLWITAGVSATATQKLLTYYKGAKNTKREQESYEKQNVPGKNAHKLSWSVQDE